MSPPEWQAHNSPKYSVEMASNADRLILEILADPSCRRDILADPRPLHRRLYASFTPPDFEEYAGTYRGAVGTTLYDRNVVAESQIDLGESYNFTPAHEVQQRMDSLLETVDGFIEQSEQTDAHGRLLSLAYLFCWFGRIHPFLDGNGHIQRAIFAAAATEMQIGITSRFAIHPRPYDRLMAIALETFTRSGEEWAEELPLAAEYLAFFLDSPYDVPGANFG